VATQVRRPAIGHVLLEGWRRKAARPSVRRPGARQPTLDGHDPEREPITLVRIRYEIQSGARVRTFFADGKIPRFAEYVGGKLVLKRFVSWPE